MTRFIPDNRIRTRLVEQLYTESMLLVDECRGYFDERGLIERDKLMPIDRVAFSCESLKVTTRLVHSLAWLLTQRAVLAGDLPESLALDPSRRLAKGPVSERSTLSDLPSEALALVQASESLHRRVARLDEAQTCVGQIPQAIQSIQDRLTTWIG